MASEEDEVREYAGLALGALLRTASEETVAELSNLLLPSTLTPTAKWHHAHGCAKGLATGLALAAEKLMTVFGDQSVLDHIDRLVRRVCCPL